MRHSQYSPMSKTSSQSCPATAGGLPGPDRRGHRTPQDQRRAARVASANGERRSSWPRIRCLPAIPCAISAFVPVY